MSWRTKSSLIVSSKATARCAFHWAASSLEISIETVKVHKKHMYSKLGIKSRSELFSIFLQAQNA